MTPDCFNQGPNHDTVSLHLKGFVRCSKSGRIAVKVINHLGDEVMEVFRVE